MMVDLSFLEKFTNGDIAKMKRYIKIYLDIAPQILDQMSLHVSEEDWEQLRIKAHSLKPQADFMGLADLKSTLVDIEDSVSAKKYGLLKELNQLAENIFAETEGSLKDYISSL